MDIMRAFVRLDAFEIAHVPETLVLIEDANTAQSDAWAVRWVCSEIDEAVACVLREITLETLLTRKQARDNILTYQI